jgi:hypothetical protein
VSAQYHLFQTNIFPPFFDRADILFGEKKIAFYKDFFVAIFVNAFTFTVNIYLLLLQKKNINVKNGNRTFKYPFDESMKRLKK